MALTKKAERTKAKLLDSAQRLISAHGFDNVSVEDITKDSGVAKGTFYHYFECKEDVVRELSRKTAMATIERAIAHEGDVIERCFQEQYASKCLPGEEETFLKKTLLSANRFVFQKALREEELAGMGTTAV